MSDETADVLAESREYLAEHGWFQGEFRDPTFRDPTTATVCAVGAVMFSQGLSEAKCMEDARVIAASKALAGVLGLNDPGYPGWIEPEKRVVGLITQWNDADGRTEQEVLDAFAKAEKVERAGFDPDA